MYESGWSGKGLIWWVDIDDFLLALILLFAGALFIVVRSFDTA